MKHNLFSIVLLSVAFASCGDYNAVMKSTDYDYKYEAAKQYFAEHKYNRAISILEESISIMKGSDKAEESLYMLGMCNYQLGDYDAASTYFKKYYSTYPKGAFAEYARFYSGRALYLSTPEARLDQTQTQFALNELQTFLEVYPSTKLKDKVHRMIFDLQDKLVEKEYLSAKLYYDLGTYFGNCTSGGNNYEACVVTARNAINEYPYAKQREQLSALVVMAKYKLAEQSVESKKDERFRETIDEFYGFKNEFPESKYMKELEKIRKDSEKKVRNTSEL